MTRGGVGYPGTLRAGFLIASLLTSACGRIGFDGPSTGGSGDAGTDACIAGSCGAPFEPAAGHCLTAEAGPFSPVANYPTQGGGFGVWSAPPFTLIADTTGGMRSLRLDGTTFTEVGALPAIGWVEAVFSDGQHFYVGAPGTGLFVVDVATTGALTVIAHDTTTLVEARKGWFGNGLLYIPAGGSGLFAYRFSGTTLTQVGASMNTMSWAEGVWASGTRVLYADGNVFRVVDFNGATFTDVVTPDTRHGGSRVWSVGDVMFVVSADGVTAYRLQGTNLIELDTYNTGNARDVWSDGLHVFVAAEANGVYALSFDGTRFALVDKVGTGGTTLGVFGDGTYVYANDANGGLTAFSGFTCRSW